MPMGSWCPDQPRRKGIPSCFHPKGNSFHTEVTEIPRERAGLRPWRLLESPGGGRDTAQVLGPTQAEASPGAQQPCRQGRAH